MARHSKWHNIRVRKGAQDKKRSKIFTLHGKLITLAAQRGADPVENPALADAIYAAKKDNVPADNIDRAVRRGAGLDKSAEAIETAIYEWYGADGVAVVIRALTDNRHRTASNIRYAFSRNGGNLAETGSVSSFAFEEVGFVTFNLGNNTQETVEAHILESDARDYEIDTENATCNVITERTDAAKTAAYFKNLGYSDVSVELIYLPKLRMDITDFDTVVKISTLTEALEDDDDVEQVWTNANIDNDLLDQAEEAIEKSRFRT